MRRLLILTCLLLWPATAGAQLITVTTEPCTLTRPVPKPFVDSSTELVRKGSLTVEGRAYTIYLPKEPTYSIRGARELGLLEQSASTWLSVDQDGDGQIASWESYYAEFPLRVGPRMFRIIGFEDGGAKLLLMPLPKTTPLAGAIVGAPAPAWGFTLKGGQAFGPEQARGKTLIIDVWSPN